MKIADHPTHAETVTVRILECFLLFFLLCVSIYVCTHAPVLAQWGLGCCLMCILHTSLSVA